VQYIIPRYLSSILAWRYQYRQGHDIPRYIVAIKIPWTGASISRVSTIPYSSVTLGNECILRGSRLRCLNKLNKMMRPWRNAHRGAFLVANLPMVTLLSSPWEFEHQYFFIALAEWLIPELRECTQSISRTQKCWFCEKLITSQKSA